MPPTPTKKGKEKPTPFPSLSPKNLQQKLYTHFLSHPKALDATMALSYSLSHRKTLDATMALSYSLSHRKTLDATMALRALNTIYSKLLSRMAVCSLRTFAPINSNSESDIPTNNSDSDLRSKQLPHAEGKKNRAFNRFMKDGSTFPRKVLNDDEKYARMDMPVTRKQGLKLLVADNSLNALEEVDDDPLSVEEYRMSYFGNIDLPQSLYKMGNIVTELKDIAFSLKVLGAPWYLLSVDWYVSCWKSYCKKDFSPTKCLLNYLENWNVTLLTMRIARIGPIVQTFLRVGS
ncbi:uncharacterized protein LOC132275864 isoform X3 [Cornus florida]|uniref:uncharacterized protein LOC132275864 isoform X3 n=1 Tax=Cornus florida TaxID=4283 RepID=UPI0028970747|nr:uncharacterized protein LOC132275864 isoform X3 [Cornus florida]